MVKGELVALGCLQFVLSVVSISVAFLNTMATWANPLLCYGIIHAVVSGLVFSWALEGRS